VIGYDAVIVLKILQRFQQVGRGGDQSGVGFVRDPADLRVFIGRRVVRPSVAHIRDHARPALPTLPDIIAVGFPRPRRKKTANKLLLAILPKLLFVRSFRLRRNFIFFHSLDSMNLDGDFSPRLRSIFAHVSRCNVILRAILLRAFLMPGLRPDPMRLPPRCFVWFMISV